jgi:hypothetical protein
VNRKLLIVNRKNREEKIKKVKIEEIIDQFDIQNDEISAYLNKKTREVCSVINEDLADAEEGKEIGSFSGAPLDKEKEIVESEDWIQLPSQFDVHEWEIMRRFCYTIEDESLRGELLNAIHGSGAFRMFKDVIYRHDIEKEWFSFKEEAFREIAIQWCEENGIEYVDS